MNGGPFGSKLVSRDYVSEGVPVIRGVNLPDRSRFSTEGFAFVSEEKANQLFANNARSGDLVFTQRGTLGQVGLIPRNCGYDRFVISQSQMKLSVDESKALAEYVYYYFRSPETVQRIHNLAFSSGVPHINLDILRKFTIDLPPLLSQRKIAAVLSAYDDLIENNTRRIEVLEEMARAIYREWFVHFRFPGHEKVRMVDSELGPIPEGWEVINLQQVCTRITDGSHWSPKTVDDGFPMASVKDMHTWGFHTDQCRKIAREDYEELVHNDCKPLRGDVLVAKDGSYLKHIFVVDEEQDVVILSSIALLRPNGRILPHVLSFYLLDPTVKSRMAGYVSGVAIPRIVLKDFRTFPVVAPPLDIQKRFLDLVGPMIRDCQLLIRKNDNLRRTRDLLLPKLISGEVSVEGVRMSAGPGAA